MKANAEHGVGVGGGVWKEGKSFTQLFFLSIAIVSAVANGAKADAKQNGRCWGGKEKCSQMSWLSK